MLRLTTSVFGAGLSLAAGIWLFWGASELRTVTSQSLVDLFAWPLILHIFGDVNRGLGRWYLAEILFESDIAYFLANGTYTESRVSTGMALHDSTRSENTIVRANLTPHLLVAKLLTSTFAVSGTENLSQTRYILAMDRQEGLIDAILAKLRSFINSRQVLADLRAPGDLQNARHYGQMNQPSEPMQVVDVHAQAARRQRIEEGSRSLLSSESEEHGMAPSAGLETEE